ncbi:MAG: sigma 54-interacting transcriptional regulator [Deltaproteobacteria bacterium]|nr:sigma 54-interacting transcriptional regulator [Deltaproteobacteria bacterium]
MESPHFELSVECVHGLLLDLARERALDPLLDLVVHRLAEQTDAALARIWLVREGDICTSCPMRDECPQEVPCLHLVVSAGESRAEPDVDWSRIDGDFRRFPIGKRKVGSVAATTEAVCVEDVRQDSKWIARPDWAEREGVLGFGGQPLVYHGEILGVLGLFTRSRFCAEALGSLRMLADHAAAAIANARAFEENARLREQLELENEYLRDEISEAQAFGEIVGVSASIRQIEEQIEQVAPTDATVLILGESGTGKELVAREIHMRSDRAERPMIRVNCASVPKELYESEFFGHVKGAFTGAVKDRVGRFATADGGTLFLDEVGEIPLELQSKLLRVLQEGQYERVGDDRTRTVDVRVVAATNRNITREVKAGRFREDLFYRLNVFPIEVPPLSKRIEDIPLLAEQFLARAIQKLKRRARLTEANMAELQRYDWPGNVRELQNAIERAVITAKSGRLRFDLPRSERASTPGGEPLGDAEASDILTDEAIRELERNNLLAALESADGKIYGAGGAAELLGLKPTTVASRIQRLGLKRPASP